MEGYFFTSKLNFLCGYCGKYSCHARHPFSG
jgi:hypothetical protein